MMYREEKSSGKGRSALHNVLAAAALLCLFAGGMVWYNTRSSGDIYLNIQEQAEKKTAEEEKSAGAAEENDQKEEKSAAVTAVTAATAASSQEAAAPEEKTREQEEIPIDFQTLQETCPDAYAWIRIPGTQIDYPVCQMVEGDQTFYLNHRADKAYEYAGSIYSENYNSRDFTDPVTVLYGHNMSNGSMFQNLHYFEDRAFFEDNREVLIYLPDQVLHYRVFASYNTNDDHLLLNHDCFRDEDVFYSFLQDILNQRSMTGFVDQNTSLSRESRILTLSTCNAYDDQRYLVQCLLMNPEALHTGQEESETSR